MSHTPTPWTAKYGDTIWAATGPVGDVNKTDDLAFIVKACNAHDELIRLLDAVLDEDYSSASLWMEIKETLKKVDP